MHTTEGKAAKFHHNGDFSGDVKIVVPKSRHEHVQVVNGKDFAVVDVPFDDLKRLVASWVRQGLMERVENASDNDVLTAWAIKRRT